MDVMIDKSTKKGKKNGYSLDIGVLIRNGTKIGTQSI